MGVEVRTRRPGCETSVEGTAFNNKAPYKATIYNWFAEFKCSRVNLGDEVPDGRPPTAVNNKNIDAVRRMIETDSDVTYHQIRAS
ncbi:hypothetical protein EVAR_42803_1 [Eumeta japonica]|uniref:Mos1 transposase HTH domain-containing protein n=1 Tax=Eumeta variegata TaxID=151549 RepID=A0A4C1WHX1_EUMVA|nr:hypothetical protein EVAR_42803_1 [Eumeta japonica]